MIDFRDGISSAKIELFVYYNNKIRSYAIILKGSFTGFKGLFPFKNCHNVRNAIL